MYRCESSGEIIVWDQIRVAPPKLYFCRPCIKNISQTHCSQMHMYIYLKWIMTLHMSCRVRCNQILSVTNPPSRTPRGGSLRPLVPGLAHNAHHPHVHQSHVFIFLIRPIRYSVNEWIDSIHHWSCTAKCYSMSRHDKQTLFAAALVAYSRILSLFIAALSSLAWAYRHMQNKTSINRTSPSFKIYFLTCTIILVICFLWHG